MKTKKATFVIDVLVSKTGNVTLVNFTESPTNLCKNDIKKAIENSKKWTPSKIKNIAVNSFITLRISLTSNFD